MPEFVLNRNYTHRSTLGRVINFAKGEPVYVPPELVKEVTAIGAERVDGVKTDMLDPEVEVARVPVGDERATAIMMAFDRVLLEGGREDFTAQGMPTRNAVERIVGFEVSNKERQDLWQKYREAKAGAE